MKVYVLIATAVYDHGCMGAFTDREHAREWGERLFAQSDRHHQFRIDEFELDDPPAPDEELLGNPDRATSNFTHPAIVEDNR